MTFEPLKKALKKLLHLTDFRNVQGAFRSPADHRQIVRSAFQIVHSSRGSWTSSSMLLGRPRVDLRAMELWTAPSGAPLFVGCLLQRLPVSITGCFGGKLFAFDRKTVLTGLSGRLF